MVAIAFLNGFEQRDKTAELYFHAFQILEDKMAVFVPRKISWKFYQNLFYICADILLRGKTWILLLVSDWLSRSLRMREREYSSSATAHARRMRSAQYSSISSCIPSSMESTPTSS